MRWRQQPSKDSRKRDLAGRSAALERELTAAQETEDALATAIALNNLGTMHADLEEWEPAYERFADAARQVPAEASLEERATPHGNAANAARRLHDWPNALRHALFVDAVAGQADDEGQRAVALAAVGLVRKALTADEFPTMLEAAIESLPKELRGFVRRDDFLNPTVVHGELPGRNDPCPCGSGKKYKHCCLKRTA